MIRCHPRPTRTDTRCPYTTLLRFYDPCVRSGRVATHCTEADVSKQHIGIARDLGMDVSGFLMMSHMIEPEALAQQALLMESYGVQCVYVTDSGGALDMDGVRARLQAYDRVLKPETQRGDRKSTRLNSRH